MSLAKTEKVAEFYHPLLTFDGREVTLESSEAGGPCGIFVDEHEPLVEMVAS